MRSKLRRNTCREFEEKGQREALPSLLGEGAGSWHSKRGSSYSTAAPYIGSGSPPVAARPSLPARGIVWVLLSPSPNRRESRWTLRWSSRRDEKRELATISPSSSLKQKQQTSSQALIGNAHSTVTLNITGSLYGRRHGGEHGQLSTSPELCRLANRTASLPRLNPDGKSEHLRKDSRQKLELSLFETQVNNKEENDSRLTRDMGVQRQPGTRGQQSTLPPLNLGTSAQMISKEEGGFFACLVGFGVCFLFFFYT